MIYNTLNSHYICAGIRMKRFLTICITVLFFVVAVILGLKNQQVVILDFVIAQDSLRLSTLLAIVFAIGFSSAVFFASFFYLKLKVKNRSLRKLNEKQQKVLNDLTAKLKKSDS